MPLYEYICQHCEHRFEEVSRMDDLPPACPKCGKETKKTVSHSSFQLKGGGWADDGYSGNSE
jgi:putative FmdB family regulatory protein